VISSAFKLFCSNRDENDAAGAENDRLPPSGCRLNLRSSGDAWQTYELAFLTPPTQAMMFILLFCAADDLRAVHKHRALIFVARATISVLATPVLADCV
jgi:hypothetical protein